MGCFLLRKLLLIPLLFAISNSQLYSRESPPYAKTLIFQSTDEIEKKFDDFQKFAKKKIDLFIQYGSKSQFDLAFQEWNVLMSQFLVIKTKVERTAFLTENPVRQLEIFQWESKLNELLDTNFKTNKKLVRAFIKCGQNAQFLSPQQRYLCKKLLGEYLTLSIKIPAFFQSNIQSALDHLAQFDEQNFSIYSNEKAYIPPSNKLRIFNANLLCFPDDLPYFFGGIRPWKLRIDALANKLIDTKADILALQEIWDPEIMPILIDKLKNHYPFIIYDVGNLYFTLAPQLIAFNSGLFIASKVPLDSISFTPFTNHDIRKGINRGALAATFTIGDQKISIVNTHLQHEAAGGEAELRSPQLNQASEILQKYNTDNSSWGFICGDFNIKAFSEEFNQMGMADNFNIPYLFEKTKVTSENATETDYFNDLVYTPIEERKNVNREEYILDYCISPKNAPFSFETQRVVLYQLSRPDQALSDHNGLLSTWTWHLPQ